MLNWLKRKMQSAEFPNYSRLRTTPSFGLPPGLEEQERNAAFLARRDALEKELLERGKRPADDVPLFNELLVGEGAVPSIPTPGGGGQCLPIFSSPFRAADYARIFFASARRVRYLSSSPVQLLGMLRDLKSNGFDSFAIDRCPRCSVFTALDSDSMKSAADIVTVWGLWKATELARADLYLEYALEAARSGRLEESRNVALECVGHVSLEDPRSHLLLGKIGVALGDQTLLREAAEFLRFFRLTEWEDRLNKVERSGSTTFSESE